jgi:hypothetical protein
MKAIYLLIFVGLYACNDDPDAIMLQKKWRMVETNPVVEGSIYIDGLESLDLSELPHSKTNTSNMYYQRIGEKKLIRFTKSESYFEVLKLTEDKLEIGLYNRDQIMEEESMIVKLKFQSVDE